MTFQGDAMKTPCQAIQDRLAERGADALRDDPLAMEHVESCDECAVVLEGLGQLDELLEQLPSIDAPEAVVQRLMSRPELMMPPLPSPSQELPSWGGRLRHLGRTLAKVWRPSWAYRHPLWTAAAALLVVAVSWRLTTGPAPQLVTQVGRFQAPVDVSEPLEARESAGRRLAEADRAASQDDMVESEVSPEALDQVRALGYLGSSGLVDSRQDAAKEAPATSSNAPQGQRAAGQAKEVPKPASSPTASPAAPPPAPSPPAKRRPEPPPARADQVANEMTEELVMEDSIIAISELPSVLSASEVSTTHDLDTVAKLGEMKAYGSYPGQDRADGALRGKPVIEGAGVPVDELASSMGVVAGDGGFVGGLAKKDGSLDGTVEIEEKAKAEVAASMRMEAARGAAEEFLQRLRRTEDVTFQEAAGYWRNTYLPGDPALRHLAARLDAAVAARAEQGGPRRDLHGMARQPSQPFDAPDTAALAVYLHADQKTVDGRQRLLVQVGLKGTERHSGRRGSMQVAVVLDLTEMPSSDDRRAMSALLSALAKAQDLGDRFRLFVAGPGGGEAVAAEDFRHGPLSLELARRLETLAVDLRRIDATYLSLEEAYQQALVASSGADDPEAPLGSSMVLLVTPNGLGDVDRFATLAHAGAVGGVVTSAVGVGEVLDLEALDLVALAGQGHRRLIQLPAEAERLVDRELAAVGRVIARALRLRIRLAPGVHLVEVLGSERLDSAASQRVREAEQSIDQRLARNLGLAADRGDDEEGLQIVIPTFYAGDSHVVLLDLVTDGAGPIVDVRVRYKDLVYLENGVARARLDLPRGRAQAPGPLERNVLENRLAMRLREVLEQAATAVSDGEPALAAELLLRHEALLRGLGTIIPGWLGDADIGRDLRLLSEYRAVLTESLDEDDWQYLQDSLRLSGLLKTLPPPSTEAEK